MPGLRWRILWPVSLVAICLVILCVFTAVSLFHQHATIAGVFSENVASRKAAAELEECLTDLIALEHARVETVAPLHARARTHLKKITELADEPDEQLLAARMTNMFDAYLRHWEALPPPSDPNHEAAVREVTHGLETQVLAPCTEFRLYNGRRLEQITAQHERVLNQLAWGMAGIGGLGAIAGIVLGFGVARAWSRTIGRLRVQIRDAAGKLGPDLPDIVFTGERGFGELHEEVDRLSNRIENVVQELQNRDREVARAEQLAAVGQLAAGVGHEIRNPLTSIKMLIQAGLEGADQNGLTTEDLKVIEGEIRRMERSLQTFLEFARPPKLERREVDLLAVIDAVLGLTRGRAEKQKVETNVHKPPGRITLKADAGQLKQVLVNLSLNALDAMPAGGTLSFVLRRAAGRVIVEVEDTGTGIPPSVMARVFQPFVTTKDTGLGLGLVISRRIVEDHGGTIAVANRAAGGTKFIISLPDGE
jgi:two-component system sensor histidine kinase HydH